MGTKVNPGKFDCYSAAEPDEPIFVLLARDPQAAVLVRQWADDRQKRTGVTEKVTEARKLAEDMDMWRFEHTAPPTKR